MQRLLLTVCATLVAVGCTVRDDRYCPSLDPATPIWDPATETCVAAATADGGIAGDGGTSECSPEAPVPYASGVCGGCRSTTDCPEGLSCDPYTGACRVCATHADCSDGVCDRTTGTCLDSGLVAYVSNSGIGEACSREARCALITALDGDKNWFQLESGTYDLTDVAAEAEPRNLTLVGSGANPANVTLLSTAQGGSTIEVFDQEMVLDTVTIVSQGEPSTALYCAMPTGVTVYNSVLQAPIADGDGVQIREGCQLRLVGSTISNSRTAVSIATGGSVELNMSRLENNYLGVSCGYSGDNSSFSARRTHFLAGNDSSYAGDFYSECAVDVQHSIIEGYTGYTAFEADGSGTIAFNTFSECGDAPGRHLNCVAASATTMYGNLIVNSAFMPSGAPNCQESNTRRIREFSNDVFDNEPLFYPFFESIINEYAGPALEQPAVDFHGVPRPQGATPEFGAVEVLEAP